MEKSSERMEFKANEDYLIRTGPRTEEEIRHLLEIGLIHEKDGEYMDISTLSESGFKDLDLTTSPVPGSPVRGPKEDVEMNSPQNATVSVLQEREVVKMSGASTKPKPREEIELKDIVIPEEDKENVTPVHSFSRSVRSIGKATLLRESGLGKMDLGLTPVSSRRYTTENTPPTWSREPPCRRLRKTPGNVTLLRESGLGSMEIGLTPQGNKTLDLTSDSAVPDCSILECQCTVNTDTFGNATLLRESGFGKLELGNTPGTPHYNKRTSRNVKECCLDNTPPEVIVAGNTTLFRESGLMTPGNTHTFSVNDHCDIAETSAKAALEEENSNSMLFLEDTDTLCSESSLKIKTLNLTSDIPMEVAASPAGKLGNETLLRESGFGCIEVGMTPGDRVTVGSPIEPPRKIIVDQENSALFMESTLENAGCKMTPDKANMSSTSPVFAAETPGWKPGNETLLRESGLGFIETGMTPGNKPLDKSSGKTPMKIMDQDQGNSTLFLENILEDFERQVTPNKANLSSTTQIVVPETPAWEPGNETLLRKSGFGCMETSVTPGSKTLDISRSAETPMEASVDQENSTLFVKSIIEDAGPEMTPNKASMSSTSPERTPETPGWKPGNLTLLRESGLGFIETGMTPENKPLDNRSAETPLRIIVDKENSTLFTESILEDAGRQVTPNKANLSSTSPVLAPETPGWKPGNETLLRESGLGFIETGMTPGNKPLGKSSATTPMKFSVDQENSTLFTESILEDAGRQVTPNKANMSSTSPVLAPETPGWKPGNETLLRESGLGFIETGMTPGNKPLGKSSATNPMKVSVDQENSTLFMESILENAGCKMTPHKATTSSTSPVLAPETPGWKPGNETLLRESGLGCIDVATPGNKNLSVNDCTGMPPMTELKPEESGLLKECNLENPDCKMAPSKSCLPANFNVAVTSTPAVPTGTGITSQMEDTLNSTYIFDKSLEEVLVDKPEPQKSFNLIEFEKSVSEQRCRKSISTPHMKVVGNLSRNESLNLMKFDSSSVVDVNPNNEDGEDLEDTITIMEKLLALANEQEEATYEVQVVKETPAKRICVRAAVSPSPKSSPIVNKRINNLENGSKLSPRSPLSKKVRMDPEPIVFKTPISRAKTVLNSPLPSPSSLSKNYKHVTSKVDSGLRKPSLSSPTLGLESPVAEYIHSKPAPSPFHRIVGVAQKPLSHSVGKPGPKPASRTTLIPRPSLPNSSLQNCSKLNVQSTLRSEEKGKFKPTQYVPPPKVVPLNASFAEKHHKENFIAQRHTGERVEDNNASLVHNSVIPKKFIHSKLATPKRYNF